MFEEGSLSANDEYKFIAAVGLHFAEPADQLYGVSPTQIPGQFSREQARMKQIEIVPDVCGHTSSMAFAKFQGCIPLLT
jgi:hypothetical protein